MKLMEPEKIKEQLKTDFIGQKIRYFTEVTSTNDVAKELATKGAKEGTMILAETQTQGKGRLGRRWLSPRGGIWFSVILRPTIPAKNSYQLTFMAAVAVAKTIRKMFKVDAEVKWPNDILVNERKVCGILTETCTIGDAVDFAVIGVGVNANVDLTSFPKDLRGSVTSLEAEVGGEVERERFLRALLRELENYYRMLSKKKFGLVLEEWKSLTTLFGAYVEVTSFEEKIRGLAVGVDRNGALEVLLKNGTVRKILSGDVVKQERQH
jgi:BirA family biotin operon repressor/biotin-[acetyl-CoA-carboxylase] ligase